MAYDPNKDYAKALADARARGASDAEVARLNDERNEKIAANQDYYAAKGIHAGDAHGAAAQEYINAYQNRQSGTGNTVQTPTRTAQTPTAAQQTVQTVQTAQSGARDPQTYLSKSSAALSQTARQTADAGKLAHLDTSAFRGYLDQWLEGERTRANNAVDYATEQGVNQLGRTWEDAQDAYRTQLDQVSRDEALARDNQALRNAVQYGGASGVGNAQIDAITAAAMTNRQSIRTAQTRLRTDITRQIADLRAQGQYEKSDQALTLANQYLAKLFELEQYAAQYNLSVDQMNSQLDQWYANYLTQLRQMDISADQWNQQMAFQREQYDYQKAQDAKSWDWKAREYADNRADTAWQQGLTERQYADNRADTAWQQGLTERQYADNRADTAWQQGLTERQYADSRADTVQQRALAARQTAAAEQQAAQQQAYSQCKTMLDLGIMPDAARLSAAGISRQEAELWISAVMASNAAKQTSAGKTAGMKLSTAEKLAESGTWSDAVLNTLLANGYDSDTIMRLYGDDEDFQSYMRELDSEADSPASIPTSTATTGTSFPVNPVNVDAVTMAQPATKKRVSPPSTAGSGTKVTGNVSFNFSESDGIITINGRKFAKAADAAQYIRSLNLSDAQSKNLSSKIMLWPNLAQTLRDMLEEE